MTRRLAALACALSLPTLAHAAQTLPAEFAHDRIHVRADVGGEPVRFYTDTGGGWNAIAESVVTKAKAETTEVAEGGRTFRMVSFDALGITTLPLAKAFQDGKLVIAPPDQLTEGGFLGGRWFADRIWELDYAAKTMRVLDAHASDGDAACVPLGFQTDKDGTRTTHFPSMDFTVDGETLGALLDTGATMTVAENAVKPFGVALGTQVGTSFIEKGVFERWKEKHPDWRVVESADAIQGTYFRAIEVPQIEIAGQTVGPVWFAERPDGVFQQYMASMMDRPTWGALGGSAFRHFRVVIDYPASRGCFYAYPKKGDAA